MRPFPPSLLRASTLVVIALLWAVAGCGGPRTAATPDPASNAVETGLEPTSAHPDPSAPDAYEGWVRVSRDDLGLRFALPPGWDQREADGMFFVSPPAPEDDSVVLLLQVAPGELDAALARLDGAFPMKELRYKERNTSEVINGLDVTYGEGVGFSTDFEADLHFFIMVVEATPHTTLIAAYVRESVFQDRKARVLGIIQSIERL